jgi:hypothetical protein
LAAPYSEADQVAFNTFRSKFSEADQTITHDQYRALTFEELDALISDSHMLRPDAGRARLFHPSSGQGEASIVLPRFLLLTFKAKFLFLLCIQLLLRVAQSRKRHWEGLNTVLAVNKKAAIKEDRFKSVGYSHATWEQVKDFFPIVVGAIAAAPVAGISEDLLAALHKYLYCATVCIGSINQRVHFIAPIIITVCSHFGGQMQILADEEIQTGAPGACS